MIGGIRKIFGRSCWGFKACGVACGLAGCWLVSESVHSALRLLLVCALCNDVLFEENVLAVFARVCNMAHGCTSDIVRQDVSDEL